MKSYVLAMCILLFYVSEDEIFFLNQGKFQGLDLNEELHVGGYPNYTVLAKTAGIKTGFVGKFWWCFTLFGWIDCFQFVMCCSY